MRIPGADQAIDNLMEWSGKAEWNPYRQLVFSEHFDPLCDHFDMTHDDLVDAFGDAFGMVLGCVIEDFFAARFGEDGEINIVDDYLKRRGWREKVGAKRYLAALRDSTLSLYEVVEINPGTSLTIQDIVLGGDPVTVHEKLGSETAARWDRIAGRVVTVNKKSYLGGGLLLFSHDAAERLLLEIDDTARKVKAKLKREAKKLGKNADLDDVEIRRTILESNARLFTSTWMLDALENMMTPMPEMVNSDGDEILMSETRFPIHGDVTAVADAINGIDRIERDDPKALRWTWHALGSPTQKLSNRDGLTLQTTDDERRTVLGCVEICAETLTLTTNSKNRADKGQELLMAHLGDMLGQPLTTHQTVEKLIEERPDDPDDEVMEELPPEIVEAAIQAHLDAHYRNLLDNPIPVLDGRTPRQAVRTKKGKQQVINWLKRLENGEARQAASQGRKPYDTSWMWTALNLGDQR